MVDNIQALTFEDEDEIINLVKSSIYHGDELHIGNLVQCDQNVSNFYKLEIFPIILDEDPIFGYYDNHKLLGLACCSTKINKMYKLKDSVALGAITITHPDYRRQGIGTDLRIKIGEDLNKRGIKKFVFEIKQDNSASLQNAQKIAEQLKAKANLVSFKFEGSTNVF
jgi:GNAT superfamily N-acetyltransferase